MTNKCNNTLNDLSLQRHPIYPNERLRAWDAADEYLLNTIHEQSLIKTTDKVLIFNDSFGALCLSIAVINKPQSITVITDSINTKNGIYSNAKSNNIDLNSFNVVNGLSDYNENYNHIIIKSPKSLDYLIYFLSKINSNNKVSCNIMIAGMVKHLPKNLWNSLESNFGTTQTSLAKKKAKIITLKLNKNNTNSKYPASFKYNSFNIYNHAAVFSKNSLDIGTRFLIENLPVLNDINDIIDLGCGNGVVGLHLTKMYTDANITFTDESYMAVESAKLTLNNNHQTLDKINFKVNNCLDDFKKDSIDLIVCNPPFHQSQNIGIQVALTMFNQSFSALRNNGYLIVVANRHLPYYTHLKRIFKSVTNLATNQKFNIFLLQK